MTVRPRAAALLVGLLAVACGPAQKAAPVSQGCPAPPVTRTLAFIAPDSADTLTAEALGPNCEEAVFVMTIRAADGEAVWAFAAPMRQGLAPAIVPVPGQPLSPAAVGGALELWSEIEVKRTRDMAAWPEGALAPRGAGEGAGARWVTTLDRRTFEDIRARNLPAVCYASGPGRTQCVYFEPAAGVATVLFDVES